MEHKECRENLSAFLDGELSGDYRLSLEEHLASCAECSRELAELRTVSALIKKHAPLPAPASLKERIFGETPAPAAGWLRPAAAFAAAAALLVLGLPRLLEKEKPVYSPQLFSNSYYEEEASGGGAAKKESPALAGDAASAGAGEVSPGPGPAAPGARKYAVPAFKRNGALAQAKFAARPAPAALAGSQVGIGLAFQGAAPAAGKASAMRGNTAPAERLPGWLGALIRQLETGPRGNPPYSVWKFSYKDRTVYYTPPQCCDQYSRLYDETGAVLCAPDGGMGGGGDGKCADFYALRKDGKVVWQDPRGQR